MRRAVVLSFLMVGFGLAGCPSPAPITQLQPPPAGQGFQLTIDPFPVAAGDEVQACYFFEVPGEPGTDVWVSRYEMAQAIGSHHMNIFRVKTIKNLNGAPGEKVVSFNGQGECFNSANWSDWPLVTNTQQGSLTDWSLPSGVGAKFKAGEKLMLQTHWVNASTQKTPEMAQVSVNFWTMAAPPANELGTMFATNQNIRVCPGDVAKQFSKTCRIGGGNVNVVAANGHFHSRGTKFEMYVVDAMGNVVGDKFYESTSWDDPPMSRNFSVTVPEGGGVQWRCSYDFPTGSCGNPDQMCCYTFGGTVETQEHCNAFVYFWPGTDYNCF